MNIQVNVNRIKETDSAEREIPPPSQRSGGGLDRETQHTVYAIKGFPHTISKD